MGVPMIDRTQPAAGQPKARRRSCLPPLGLLTAVVALAALGHGRIADLPVPRADERIALRMPEPETGQEAIPAQAAPIPSQDVLDPWHTDLAGKLSRWAWTPPEAPTDEAERAAPVPPAAAEATPPRTAMTVPLPVPRPPELRGTAPRRASRAPVRQEAALPPAPTPEDNRSFFEKLFGVESPPARADTALETKPADRNPRPRLRPRIPTSRRGRCGRCAASACKGGWRGWRLGGRGRLC